jgi:hypothetical protein
MQLTGCQKESLFMKAIEERLKKGKWEIRRELQELLEKRIIR